MATTDHPCSVDGEADIYGIGIRVGLYVQWYCTTLAYLYDPDKATEITIMNYCFSIAVAAASLVHRHAIFEHELVIIAVLLMLPPTIIVLTALESAVLWLRPGRGGAKPPKQYGVFEVLRDCAGVLATAFLLSVAVWELFEGVNQARVAPGCWPVFISSFYLGGRYDVWLKALSIMFAILAPVFLIGRMIGRIRRSWGKGHLIESVEQSDRPCGCPTRTKPKLDRIVFGSVTTRAVVAMIWGLIASCVIAKIETIIKQNQIQNLMDPLQTGQLIPLIIGGLMFSIVTYEVVLHGKRQKAIGVQLAAPQVEEGNSEKDA